MHDDMSPLEAFSSRRVWSPDNTDDISLSDCVNKPCIAVYASDVALSWSLKVGFRGLLSRPSRWVHRLNDMLVKKIRIRSQVLMSQGVGYLCFHILARNQ